MMYCAKGIKFRVFNFCVLLSSSLENNIISDCDFPFMAYSETIEVRTRSSNEIVDITKQVNTAVKRSKVEDGIITVFTPHTTTALTVNENEGRLIKDIENKLLDLVPKGQGYHHDGIDGNAHSHILASIIGCTVTIPIIGGVPSLGTWQSILFIELDGPRNRKVIIQITYSEFRTTP
jgi:secondary thiamine-phosphate synthase enzyme